MRAAFVSMLLLAGCGDSTRAEAPGDVGADAGAGDVGEVGEDVDTGDAVGEVGGDVESDTTIADVIDSAPPPDLCAAYKDVRKFDLDYAGASVKSPSLGGFFAERILVGKIVVPADAKTGSSVGHVTVAEYLGPNTSRVATLSTRPCDFRDMEPFPPPSDPAGATHPMAWSFGTTANVNFVTGGSAGTTPVLTPGRTYYFNVQNYSPDLKSNSCGGPTDKCDVVINFVVPLN